MSDPAFLASVREASTPDRRQADPTTLRDDDFDPDTLDRDPSVLRRIVREFDGRIALDCWVLEPGMIERSASVELVDMPVGADAPKGNAR
jgi:hypothetical protein